MTNDDFNKMLQRGDQIKEENQLARIITSSVIKGMEHIEKRIKDHIDKRIKELKDAHS